MYIYTHSIYVEGIVYAYAYIYIVCIHKYITYMYKHIIINLIFALYKRIDWEILTSE